MQKRSFMPKQKKAYNYQNALCLKPPKAAHTALHNQYDF